MKIGTGKLYVTAGHKCIFTRKSDFTLQSQKKLAFGDQDRVSLNIP
jgi:hypothetical protein